MGVSKNSKPKTEKKICEKCNRSLAITQFYDTRSKLSTDTKLNICKICINDMININDINTVYQILQLMDVPFVNKYWETALEKGESSAFGNYLRMCNSLPQLKNKTWKNSIFKDGTDSINIDDIINNSESDIEITKELIQKWGRHDSPDDYCKLENFYNDMMRTNTIETTQDIIYLKKLAIISLKMDRELEDGNYDETKKLGDLFSKYMADSKFRAMDKSEADKSGGIRNFCTIYAEIEKDDFIPPWEHYQKIKGITQDIVDKTIMHIENFTLKLNKIEKMTTPPLDTPKLKSSEADYDNALIINDIEVDIDIDTIKTEDEL